VSNLSIRWTDAPARVKEDSRLLAVRKHDASDWRTQPLRRFSDARCRTSNARINEGETLVFPDQETIDDAEARQTKEVFRFLNNVHAQPREIQ
jgi:hypothetical protein